MKRNPHIIVQQVCPIEKNKDGGTHPWKVCTYVFHKGLNACSSAYYRTKKRARREQHTLCKHPHLLIARIKYLKKLIDMEGGSHDA
ncbi:MAG: hypothetical protein KHX31_02585 [Akkermansia sp.]|uniref:hypothetical protein n=1 Tax=Akkermansia sp. TaxID=1872421 RepID=UPI0025BF58FB|nr:hypothetical protein [Akkermansia sp.]MBS5507500.1 hypothetical protein [Akkermansia sp.]